VDPEVLVEAEVEEVEEESSEISVPQIQSLRWAL